MLRTNVEQISDLVSETNRYYTYNQFIDKYGQILSWLEYVALLHAIPKQWYVLIINEESGDEQASVELLDKSCDMPSISNTICTIFCTNQYS